MSLLRSGIALALMVSVMAFARPARSAVSDGGAAMDTCRWCSASGAGDGHEYGVASGAAMAADMAPHGMVSGSCSSHHGWCQQSNAMKFSTLDRLSAIASAGDMEALNTVLDMDTDGSYVFDATERRLDVKGCDGEIIAVMWMKELNSITH